MRSKSFEEFFEEHQDWVEDELVNQLQDKLTTQSSVACKVLPRNIESKTVKVKNRIEEFSFIMGAWNYIDTILNVTNCQ